MAERKTRVEAVPEIQPAPPRKGKVRVRNITYPLTGSVNVEGRKPIKFSIRPNVWTEVPEEVYQMLKSKFYDLRYADVPDALPESDGTYRGDPDRTRKEPQNAQYLIEFS